MSIPQEWLKYAPKPKTLTGTEKWNVFLSYRSVNRTWVLHLYDVLIELGFKVFMDQCVLKPGDSLVALLNAALRSTQAGVLMWSSAAENSAWVQKEYDTMETMSAQNPDFNFVPIKLDENKLPPFAANRIYMDFSTYPDGPNGGELIRLLHGIVGKPLDADTVRFANAQDEAAKDAAYEIEAAKKNKDPEEIIQAFENGGLPWKASAALGCKAAESLIKLGENDVAISMLEKIQVQFPNSIRPKQLYALAFARRGKEGDLKNAQRILGKLYAKGEGDPETLGIYARTWMDRYNLSKDVSDLEQSRDYYVKAFERAPDDYYTGVNAAAKSIFIGTPESVEEGIGYAKKVEEIVGVAAHKDDYWKTATVAEVMLMQMKYTEAADMYKQAVRMVRQETASHKSTWQQACLLMDKLKPATEEKAGVLAAFSHLPGYDKQ